MDIADLRTRASDTFGALREQHLSSLRPTHDFFDVSRLSRPADLPAAQSRVSYNVKYYFTNYVVAVVILALYAVLTNVLLLFAIVFIVGAAALIRIYVTEPVVIAGHTVAPRQLYTATAVVGVPILWLASPFSTFVWVIGSSVVLVLAHAVALEPPIESQFGSTIEPV